MCDRTYMLIIFLILKIIILVATPITLYFLYKRESKVYNLVGGLDCFFILLFIILKLVGFDCVSNSTFSNIIKIAKENSMIEEQRNTYYDSIYSNNIYIDKDNKNAYSYNININPLNDATISCNKPSYMNNYGDSLSAIMTLISNYYGIDNNEINALDYLIDNNYIDCNKGFDFDTIFKTLGNKYYYNIYEISSYDVLNYVFNGNSVLVETRYNDNGDNFGCEKDYIVIYNVKEDDGFKFNIINPNDKDYSYFCPSNTIGYGDIIKDNQNSKSYTLEEIDNKALRYFVIEVR